MAPTLISTFSGSWLKIDGVVLTYPFTDTALLLLEIETALIDIGDQGDCLGEVDVNGLVRPISPG